MCLKEDKNESYLFHAGVLLELFLRLEMNATYSSKTLITFSRLHNIPEDVIFYIKLKLGTLQERVTTFI
jgi:hypothetical protein